MAGPGGLGLRAQLRTQFVFIKATEGGDHVDERFRANWDGAGAAGIPRGAYHFVFWCRSAKEQMDWFKKNVPNDPSALPPVLDVEWNGHSQTCPRKLRRSRRSPWSPRCCRRWSATPVSGPIIYTDITFHKDVLEGELPDYPHWLRSTAAEPEQRFANRQWMLWQFTSTGRVPGVRGDVDRNASTARRPTGRRSSRPIAIRESTSGCLRRVSARTNRRFDADRALGAVSCEMSCAPVQNWTDETATLR